MHNCVTNVLVGRGGGSHRNQGLSQRTFTPVSYVTTVSHSGFSVSAPDGRGHTHGTVARLSRKTQKRGDDTLRFTRTHTHTYIRTVAVLHAAIIVHYVLKAFLCTCASTLSPEPEPRDRDQDQQTMIMFERK